MEKKTRTKRIISFALMMMLLFSLTMPVSAGEYSYTYYAPTKTWKMNWQVRASGSYKDIGDCLVILEPQGSHYWNYLILTSDITFETKIGLKKKTVTLPRGTKWHFLVVDGTEACFDLEYIPGDVPKDVIKHFLKMRGKITRKAEAQRQGIYNELPIIKIDGLGTGFYVKYT